MNVMFKPILKKSVLVFFNNILVYSIGWSTHMIHLKRVLHLLRENQLHDKISKYSFGTNKIEYLGHIILRGLVAMDASKLEGRY